MKSIASKGNRDSGAKAAKILAALMKNKKKIFPKFLIQKKSIQIF